MRRPIHLIAVAVLSSSSIPSGAFEYANELANWAVTKAPESGDARWFVAQSDGDYDWCVFLRGGTPSARLAGSHGRASSALPFKTEPGSYAEGLAGRRLDVKVEDGWIVAFHGGEWGAGLW